MRGAALPFLALAACVTEPDPIYREPERTSPHLLAPRPEIAGYAEAVGAGPVPWSADSLAADFEELHFVAEWGEDRPGLPKFEGPVRLALAGPELAAYREDAADLVARLSAAAPGLDLAMAEGEAGEITFRTAPAAAMEAVAPGALCFFIPFRGDWAAFRAAEADGRRFWEGPGRLDAITVFVPAFAAPHEIRACIEEEATQALGPANDIYRLEDSIFNDDNVHGRATAFDLLMLRALYDPSLHAGMSREAAGAAARAVFAAVFAASGAGSRSRAPRPEDAAFARFATRAESEPAPGERMRWALRAVAAAERFGPEDHRLPAALLEAGRIAWLDGREPESAALLRRAEAMMETRLGPEALRLADLRGDLGAILLRLGRPAEALSVLDQAIPVFAAHAADWRLAHALRWRALALAETGRQAEAGREARRALAWAAWVYGAESRALAAWRIDFAAAGLVGA